ERVCTHHAAADAACHRQLCDLPVPVGVERPAGGADVLRRVAHRATTDGGSGGPDRFPRAGLAPTHRRGVRLDHHPADRLLRLAALLRARAAGGLGEGVARRRLARPPPQPKVNRFTRYVLRRVVLPGIDSAQAVSNAREPPARTPPRPCACPPFPGPAPAAPLAPARRSPGPRPPAYRYWPVPCSPRSRGPGMPICCAGPCCPGPCCAPGGSARRFCTSWFCAAICWATSAVWIPWNSPSSQPTS